MQEAAHVLWLCEIGEFDGSPSSAFAYEKSLSIKGVIPSVDTFSIVNRLINSREGVVISATIKDEIKIASGKSLKSLIRSLVLSADCRLSQTDLSTLVKDVSSEKLFAADAAVGALYLLTRCGSTDCSQTAIELLKSKLESTCYSSKSYSIGFLFAIVIEAIVHILKESKNNTVTISNAHVNILYRAIIDGLSSQKDPYRKLVKEVTKENPPPTIKQPPQTWASNDWGQQDWNWGKQQSRPAKGGGKNGGKGDDFKKVANENKTLSQALHRICKERGIDVSAAKKHFRCPYNTINKCSFGAQCGYSHNSSIYHSSDTVNEKNVTEILDKNFGSKESGK